MKKISISDIASEAGVSTCTVSRIINGKASSKVSEKVRKRVMDVVKKYNYRPDIAARSLASGKSSLLGVQILSINSPGYYADILNIIELEAFKRGYNVLLGVSQWSRGRERKSIEVMVEKGVEGIIWVPSGMKPQPGLVKRLREIEKPITYLLKSGPPGASAVINDQELAGFRAAEYLKNQGIGNVVFFAVGENSDSHCKLRADGFRRAMNEFGLTGGVFNCEARDFEGIAESAKKLLSGKKIPKGIALSSDNHVFALQRALAGTGLRIGKNLAVIGIDNSDFSSKLEIPLTSVGFDNVTLGKLAVRNIINQIEGKNPAIQVLEPVIIPGKSCREK